MILMLMKYQSLKKKNSKYNSFKYFTGYNDNDVIRPLYIELSQMTGYINKFDENKIKMSFMIKDKQLLKNTIKYEKKIERLMSIDFDSKTIYGDYNKYIKTKIKTYKDGITTDFYDKKGSKKIPEEKILHKCLSMIILDSVLHYMKSIIHKYFQKNVNM